MPEKIKTGLEQLKTHQIAGVRSDYYEPLDIVIPSIKNTETHAHIH
jgi:hypothetical protein